MADSPNKGYDLQQTGQNFGVWGVRLNNNFSIADLNLGGWLTANVAGSSNVTVSSGDADYVLHELTGVLTGNIKYIFPNTGSFYFIRNATTGSFTVTVVSDVLGSGVVVPQGYSMLVFINSADTEVVSAISALSSLTLATPLASASGGTSDYFGGTTGGSANVQTVSSTTPTGFALTNGNSITFNAGFSVSGAATLNVNSTGAKSMKKRLSTGLTDVATGDINSGQIYTAIYDSGADVYQIVAVSASTPVAPDGIPIGVGTDYWGAAAPTNWIFAYGQAISRSTYASLFAVMGTTYGAGDGSTTFNVPDKRGRSSFGKDDMGGSAAGRLTGLTGGITGSGLGNVGGEQATTLTTANIPSHNHEAGTPASTAEGGIYRYGVTGSFTATRGFEASSSSNRDKTPLTSSVGGGGAHNTVPPGIVCNYIIYAGA